MLNDEACQLAAWLILAQVPGLSYQKWYKLMPRWPTPAALLAANAADLSAYGMTAKQIAVMQSPNQEHIQRCKQWLSVDQHHLVTCDDSDYPPLLKQIPNSPLVLFAWGNRHLLLQAQIAIVGSRQSTSRGSELAQYFAQQLVQAGLVITSGLALGIDGASHRGALAAGPKSTIAVLGSGFNCIYPRQHQALARDIVDRGGLLLSQWMPDVPPRASHFPQRNRVIAGMSVGVLVVEASLRSGSLITARLAGEYGREVFALPGGVFYPLSQGCHILIQQGAKLVTDLYDIIVELKPLLTLCMQPPLPSKAEDNSSSAMRSNLLSGHDQHLISQQWDDFSESHTGSIHLKQQKNQVDSNKIECATDIALDQQQAALLEYVDVVVTTVDQLIVRSGFTVSGVTALLSTLELMGYVMAVSGGYIRLK